MPHECPSCGRRDVGPILQCKSKSCGMMYCMHCELGLHHLMPIPFALDPEALVKCPKCHSRGEIVSRDDSEDSSHREASATAAADHSDYSVSSYHSSTEGSSSSSDDGPALLVGLGVVVVVIVVLMAISKAYQPSEEQIRAAQARQAAVDAENARRQEHFRSAREVHAPALGSFTYCQNCMEFYPGKSKPGDKIVVWDAGIEHKNVYGTGRTYYLPFEYISALEKRETLRRVAGLVLAENRYPSVELTLHNGIDGSVPPMGGDLRTSIVFDEDQTRDAFYETVASALSAWRERFLGVDGAQERERWRSTSAALEQAEEQRRRQAQQAEEQQRQQAQQAEEQRRRQVQQAEEHRRQQVQQANQPQAAVVVTPSGPSVMARPGQGKPFAQFQTDDVECRQLAVQRTTGGLQQHYDNEYYGCMYARGNQIPLSPPPSSMSPPWPTIGGQATPPPPVLSEKRTPKCVRFNEQVLCD